MEEEKEELFYLTEPTHLQENGILKGTSLRCYEVRRTVETKGKSWSPIRIEPTGYAYYYNSQTNTFSRKKSKATLSEKYVSSWQTEQGVVSNLDGVRSYGSVLFTNPHLAIISKIHVIQKNKKDLQKKIDTVQENMKALSAYDDMYDAILDEYPEHII